MPPPMPPPPAVLLAFVEPGVAGALYGDSAPKSSEDISSSDGTSEPPKLASRMPSSAPPGEHTEEEGLLALHMDNILRKPPRSEQYLAHAASPSPETAQ